MNQDQNYITIEMNFRIQLKDYRMVFGAKNLWIVSHLLDPSTKSPPCDSKDLRLACSVTLFNGQ
jgi:hypothetical protein